MNPDQQEAVREFRDETGIVFEKVYNPSVGKYDVVVTTGPSYMTKRQESMEAMSQILQGNPGLWQVAGDLFVKNMDWPGSAEMAERLRKTIDPKLMEDQDDPALQAANQQIEAMGQEMEAMRTMLQSISNSMEFQELRIKEYDSETKRISAVAAGMQPEQIQELVVQTLRDVMELGVQMPGPPEMMPEEQMMPPEGMMPPEMMAEQQMMLPGMEQ